MATIHVDVVSAEESIFSGEAKFVALPGCTSRMPPATNTNSSSPSAPSLPARLMRTAPGLMRVISGVWRG